MEIFTVTIPRNNLQCMICEIVRRENDPMWWTDYCRNLLKCRRFLEETPEAMAAPKIKKKKDLNDGFIYIIVAKDRFESPTFRKHCTALDIKIKEILDSISDLIYKTCLLNTVKYKLEPQWKKVGQYLVFSTVKESFLSATERIDAIELNINIHGNTAQFNVKPLSLDLPFLRRNRDFQLPYPVKVLPSLANARVLKKFRNWEAIQEEHPFKFKDYNNLREYWKEMHDYILPDNEEGLLFYDVQFFFPNEPPTMVYPETCLISNKEINPLFPFSSDDHFLLNVAPNIYKEFIKNLKGNVTTLCGQQLVYPENDCTVLENTSNRYRQLEEKMEELQIINEELEKENLKLKDRIMSKEEIINNLTILNMQLQEKVISEYSKVYQKNEEIQIKVLSNFDELMHTMSEYFKTHPMTQNQGQLPVGYRNIERNEVYLGYGVYICACEYDKVCVMSKTLPQFVKNLAIAVFGIKTLKESSVTGTASNRNKNKNKVPAAPRPALDSTKLQAIRATVKYYAMSKEGHDEVSADFQALKVGTYIARKICELNNPPIQKKTKSKQIINPAESCDDPINNENTEPDDLNDHNISENNNSAESNSHLGIQVDNDTSKEQSSLYEESLDYKKNEESSKISDKEDEKKESESATHDITDFSQDGADDIEST